jgi:outer membrane immunogenic protein
MLFSLEIWKWCDAMKALIGIAAIAALIGTPALAADMALKAPLPPPAPVSTWTGCYIGGNAGYGWANETYGASPEGELNNFNPGGAAVGGQFGCDYQFANKWVIGIQGMGDWSNLNGSGTELPPFEAPNTWLDTARVNWFATFTARVGYAIQPTTLLYVKGGAAFDSTHYTDALVVGGQFSSADVARAGWTVGGGVEYMFAPSWSVFIEYDYADFGKTSNPTFSPAIFFTPYIRENLEAVLVGVNYRWGGPVAKY